MSVQASGLSCDDPSLSLTRIKSLWSRFNSTSLNATQKVLQGYRNVTVVLAVRHFPYSWSPNNSLRVACASPAAWWTVAAVNFTRRLGIPVSMVEIFNEPECAPFHCPLNLADFPEI